MEPFDIDKIIKAKLEETPDLHQSESDAAKPFVWSEIQKETKRELKWYHLAAAVILLLISFSFILFSIQKKHREEMAAMNEKMNVLEDNYQAQIKTVDVKDAQVKSLADNMKELETKLTGINDQTSIIEREKVIYRTDTVYVTKTAYLTKVTNSTEQEIPELETVEQPESTQAPLVQNKETDDVIFFGYRKPSNTEASESVKLKVGTFVSNKN